MMFWLTAAVLTICASLAVLLPLARQARVETLDGANDLRVYKDQLAEVDRDLARGAIRADDAEEARAEIGRRIVRLAGGEQPAPVTRSRGFRMIALVSVCAVPLVSWGLYAVLGSPDLPSQPLEARLNKPPAESTPEELVARAENHLARNPDDGEGWEVLAPTYLRLGRYDDSAAAYRNAIRLLGPAPARLAGLGEALTLVNGGIVSAQAEAEFNRALAAEPKFAKALFFLAMGQLQDGKKDEAVAAWQAMLADPATEPTWRRAAEYGLAQAGAQVAAGPEAPGPSSDEVDAAASMSPQDRAAMIENMVAGLDEKLRANPDDPEGWIRLVRSYLVLGKPDEAKQALKRALGALGGETEAGKKVAAFAADQGVSVTE